MRDLIAGRSVFTTRGSPEVKREIMPSKWAGSRPKIVKRGRRVSICRTARRLEMVRILSIQEDVVSVEDTSMAARDRTLLRRCSGREGLRCAMR